MKVLIADKFEARGLAALKEAGCEVTCDPDLKDDALVRAIRETACTILIVRSTRVTAEMLRASPCLALVVRAGAGYNTIDVATASRESVLVANCPGKNAVAVAELTFGLILALDRQIVDCTQDLRAGQWNKKLYSVARGLKGRTLGVVGVGQIGRAVIQRARAFEMPVVAWSRSFTEEGAAELGIKRADSPEAVAAACDILSVHLAAAPETDKLINKKVFGAMKPGSYFINTARGEVVDYAALAGAVKEKDLRVGLDVYDEEPKTATGVFAAEIMDNGGIVYGTHHIGASTEQAQQAIADEAVRIVKIYMETRHVTNCVNICGKSPARYLLLVRHRNRPGVLAHTLNAISHAGVNVEEMENVICEGAEAACASIKLDAPLGADVLSEIEEGNEHIIGVSLSPLSE
jgi:D-3-phosphoglycerate dehydrogenase